MMKNNIIRILFIGVFLILIGGVLLKSKIIQNNSFAQLTGTITVDPNTTYQTISGWEATAQAGQIDCSGFATYEAQLFDEAAGINGGPNGNEDMGFNRIRLEVNSIATNNATFNMTDLDGKIDSVITPMKNRLGAKLLVNLTHVAFNDTTNLRNNPTFYSNEMLSTFQHIQSKYGWTPDFVDVQLEPDSNGAGQWTAVQLRKIFTATGNLLAANGFFPKFITPSTVSMANVMTYINEIAASASALPYLDEVSYHRYVGVTAQHLTDIVVWAKANNKKTAMLEHIGSSYPDLHNDLKEGSDSAWQQYTLAYCTTDNGAQYYVVNGANVSLSAIGKYLRQYFKYVRPDAVRIDATASSDINYYNPIAFINSDDKYVVVVKSIYPGLPSSSSMSIANLLPGTYGIRFTKDTAFDVAESDQTISSGQLVTATFNSFGVITIYQKAIEMMQKDWSGGSGQTAWSSATKFSASTNIKSSTANQLTINTPSTNTGNLTSSIFDTGGQSHWGSLTYSATIPVNTSADIFVRTSSVSDMSTAPAFSTCNSITNNTDISTNNCVNDLDRYIQYQIKLNNTDLSSTPTFATFSATFRPHTAQAPSISNIVATPGTNNASITWDTSKVTSTQTVYGVWNTYPSSNNETDTVTRVTSHTSSLSSLVPCTQYRYRVRSKDSDGREIVSSANTFDTTACTGNASIIAQTDTQIATASGGSLTLTNGGESMALTVPASFAAADSDFQIKQLDKTAVIAATSVPPGYASVGSYLYHLEALPNETTSYSSFNQPITVVYSYGNADLSGITSASTLLLYRWDGNNWNQLSNCVVDTNAKTVTCTTTAFSTFGLFGVSTSATPTPTATPTILSLFKSA